MLWGEFAGSALVSTGLDPIDHESWTLVDASGATSVISWSPPEGLSRGCRPGDTVCGL